MVLDSAPFLFTTALNIISFCLLFSWISLPACRGKGPILFVLRRELDAIQKAWFRVDSSSSYCVTFSMSLYHLWVSVFSSVRKREQFLPYCFLVMFRNKTLKNIRHSAWGRTQILSYDDSNFFVLLILAFLDSAFPKHIFSHLHMLQNGQVSHKVLREEGVAFTGQLCWVTLVSVRWANVIAKPPSTLKASNSERWTWALVTAQSGSC